MDILVRLGDVKAAELEAQADCHFVKREFQDAQGCLLQAAAIRNNDGDSVSAGNCAQKIGLVRYFLGDQTGAILSYEEAFEFRRRVDDLLGQGVTLGRMAEVFQRGGQHAKALELLEDSIRFFTQVNATKDIGTVLHNMAVSYRETGIADKAMQCYERSLAIRRQACDFKGLAATLHNLAVLYFDQSQYQSALQLLAEAFDLRKAMGDTQGLGQTILCMGRLHMQQGDTSSAIECYEEALRLAKECGQGEADKAVALLNLADVLSGQGEVGRPLAMLHEAEKLFADKGMTPGVAASHYGRGRTFYAAGRATEALACFEVAKSHFTKLADRPRLINTGIAIGNILSERRRHQDAHDVFASVLELQRELGRPRDEATTLQLISRECAALSDATGALNAGQTATDMLRQKATNSGFNDAISDDIPNRDIVDSATPDAGTARSPGSCSLH